jgi:aminoglycoside phosphotransferase (APT) family kinase protein
VADLDPALGRWLVDAGLASDIASIRAEPLTGGVASDIWRVEAGGRRFAVKRALAKLKVARDWRAPVSRNANEVEWLQTAGAIVPEAVPKILAHDAGIGAFAMEYLDPADHPVWKAELRAGRADPAFAAKVGTVLAAIHSGTARKAEEEGRFGSNETFAALRLDPYLNAAAEAHGDLAPALHALVAQTLANRKALVHGDISPKNILVGPMGPVLLDAECAWYGDPAFDIAFCLNHMLLKCLWVPAARENFLASYDALAAAYLGAVRWERADSLEARAARLLPGLFLARVDGKSPVEYVTEESDREKVRLTARRLLLSPPTRLSAIRTIWNTELTA